MCCLTLLHIPQLAHLANLTHTAVQQQAHSCCPTWDTPTISLALTAAVVIAACFCWLLLLLPQCLGGLDVKKIDMAVDKGFGFFDKDKSGFVDGAEAAEAAQKVLNMIGGPAKVRAAVDLAGGVDC
jgi:hypothetical protein